MSLKIKSVTLLLLLVQCAHCQQQQAQEELSLTAWIFIGVGILLVPLGIIGLALYLERKFGRAQKAKKSTQQTSDRIKKMVRRHTSKKLVLPSQVLNHESDDESQRPTPQPKEMTIEQVKIIAEQNPTRVTGLNKTESLIYHLFPVKAHTVENTTEIKVVSQPPTSAEGVKSPEQFKTVLEASKNVLKLYEHMSIVKVQNRIKMAPGNTSHDLRPEEHSFDQSTARRCNLVIDQLGNNTQRSFLFNQSHAERTSRPPSPVAADQNPKDQMQTPNKTGHKRTRSSPFVPLKVKDSLAADAVNVPA